MKYVKVQFQKQANYLGSGGQVYTYLVPEGDEPKVGDRVITSMTTESSFEAGYPLDMKIGKVINVLSEDDGKATKFYVWLIPLDVLRERINKNKEYKARAEERRQIRAQLDEMLKKQSDMERYERLASNPEAAELITKLKELG